MDARHRVHGASGTLRRVAGVFFAGAALVPGLATAQVPAPAAADPVAAVPAGETSAITLAAVRALRIAVPTQGLATQAVGPATVSVAADVGAVPGRATFSLRQLPADVVMDFDLPHGAISVGVAPLTDNLKFPVDVTIRQGTSLVTAHRDITLLLPTVIIPGSPTNGGPSPIGSL
jgi:hypothetical protein